MASNGGQMLLRPVALVMPEPVERIAFIVGAHDPVAIDLGDDRGR